MIASTNSISVIFDVRYAKNKENSAPTNVSENPLNNEVFNNFKSIETNLAPITIPRIIKAKIEKIGIIDPVVIPLPWLTVVQIIPLIRNGAGTFVFIIASPINNEKMIIKINCTKDMVFSFISKLLEISVSEVIITNKGVSKVRLRTLMDWIIAILGVSVLISLLMLNTKLKWPGEDANMEVFLSNE